MWVWVGVSVGVGYGCGRGRGCVGAWVLFGGVGGWLVGWVGNFELVQVNFELVPNYCRSRPVGGGQRTMNLELVQG